MSLDSSKLSRFLSLVLRHKPELIGLTLDAEGWANVDDLLKKAKAFGKPFHREALVDVVQTNEKKRFTLSSDRRRIRAAQGHSIKVELGLKPQEPPAVLSHGTATRFLDGIWADGLTPQERRQVHLSVDEETAANVGARHGKPIILTVDAAAMHREGFAFYLADNGVWLTDRVPREFLGYGAAAPAGIGWRR